MVMPKEKKNSLPHLTKPRAKLNQQEKETLRKKAFTRQIFIFSPPHMVKSLFSSDRPLFGSDGAVKVTALIALKTSVDIQALIGRCLSLLLHFHSPKHENPSFSLTD